MSEAVHTPLPWRFDGDWHRIPTIFGADGEKVASVEKDSRELPGEANIANAALIVTAVNDRPALLARVAELEAALRVVALAGPLESPTINVVDGDYISDDPDDHYECGWQNGLYHCAEIARAAISTTERGGS